MAFTAVYCRCATDFDPEDRNNKCLQKVRNTAHSLPRGFNTQGQDKYSRFSYKTLRRNLNYCIFPQLNQADCSLYLDTEKKAVQMDH